MWAFTRINRIDSFGKVYYEDLETEEWLSIKKQLLKEFNFTCYFTDLLHSRKTKEDFKKYNVEHFIPRQKDKITHKYDFMESNLFLADSNWNSWKGNNLDTQTSEKTFQTWLSYIYDFDTYFETKSFPDIPPELAKMLKLKPSFGEIRIIGKTKESAEMIKILCLNTYRPSGSEPLSQKRYLRNLPIN